MFQLKVKWQKFSISELSANWQGLTSLLCVLFPFYFPVYVFYDSKLIRNGKNAPLWSCSFLYSPSIIGATLVGLLQARKADSHTGRKVPNRFKFLHNSKAFVCLNRRYKLQMSVPSFWGTNYWSYFVVGSLQACKADRNKCTQVTMDKKFPIGSDFEQFQDFCVLVLTDRGSWK